MDTCVSIVTIIFFFFGFLSHHKKQDGEEQWIVSTNHPEPKSIYKETSLALKTHTLYVLQQDQVSLSHQQEEAEEHTTSVVVTKDDRNICRDEEN